LQHSLDSLARFVRGTLGDAPTLVGYKTQWRIFQSFCAATGTPSPFPASQDDAIFLLTTFMAYEHTRGLQVSTVRSYASGVKFVWSLQLGKDLIGDSMVPDQFANALAARHPDPTDNATLPLPASWLAKLPLPGSEPWEAPATVMAFIFLWRVSNYTHHYEASQHCMVTTLRVKHITTSERHIEVSLSKDKNVDTETCHRRFSTSTALCPVSLYVAYARSRATSAPNDPAFQHTDGSPVTADDMAASLRRLAVVHNVPANLHHHYTPHALRKGGTVAARALAFNDTWCLREGRWAGPRSMLPYVRQLPERNCATIMTQLLPGVFGTPGATR
jgi:hypothetical protein